MIKFQNTESVGTITEGVIDYEDEPLLYRLEWRMKVKPYLGMKQPTPQGGFLGLECILILETLETKAVGYRFKLFVENEEWSGGCTDARGESGDIGLDLPFRGIKNYSIDILGPVPKLKSNIVEFN